MRVSNDTLRMAFLSALEAAQRRVLTTQEQIATGRRVNAPSDDPVAAARMAHLDASLGRLDQYGANAGFARNQLGLEEEALGEVIDNLQRVRELLVQGNNGSVSATDRRIIAAEVREYRDALLGLANTTDVDGRHLFGGYVEAAVPFTAAPDGSVVYNGDQGQRSLQISDSRFIAINDSGAEIFQRIAAGNGTFVVAAAAGNTGTGTLGAGSVVDASAWVADDYTINFLTPTTYEVRDAANALVAAGTYASPAQSIGFRGIDVSFDGAPEAGDVFTVVPSEQRDVFATLDAVITALEQPAADPAARALLHSDLGQRLGDVDAALAHMIEARAEIGARVRALDQQEALNADFAVHLETTLSSVRDLDYADALSKLSQQLFGLDAAQQAFARTQNLSLFRYL